MVKAAYIHIPFCNNICSYCSFCKMYTNDIQVDKYLEALKAEITEKYQGEELSSIYIGGGTPSDISLAQLQYLLEITSLLKKEKTCEFTFECNVSISKEKLKLLKKYGVNRLSFGLESSSTRLLKIMERTHTKEDIKKKIIECRKLGFTNINGDLIYAFYDETLKELKKDLDFFLSLNLEHISCYSLIIEEHTKLYLKKYQNCPEEKDEKMYKLIHQTLTDQGYIHYEVSNFAKENYFSAHNSVYWKNEEYYGFGLSASSYIGDIRKKNTGSFKQYIAGIYDYEIEKLDKYDKMSYEMILGLRLKQGVNLKTFYQKYQQKLEEVFYINDYLENALLLRQGEKIFIPFDKWYVMNFILERFVK